MTVRRVRDADSIDVASHKPIVVFGRMRGELTAEFDSSLPATGLLAAGISILVDDSTMSKILQSVRSRLAGRLHNRKDPSQSDIESNRN